MAFVSTKNSRWVDAAEIQDLMWGYLSLKKNFSKRGLACVISQDAKRRGIKISVESVQRGFGKSAKKMPLVIKDILVSYYRQEGYHTLREIKDLIAKSKQSTRDALSPADGNEVGKLTHLWLSLCQIKSKRKLAEQLKMSLADKGYGYRLGSLQNMLGGKIKETKKVVCDTLKEILLRDFFDSDKSFKRALSALSAKDSALFTSIDAGALAQKCCEFLALYPHWTKRRLAIQLSRDLAGQGYLISAGSLQYALAGRRSFVKNIILNTVVDYIANEPQFIKKIDMLKTMWRRRQGVKSLLFTSQIETQGDIRSLVSQFEK